MFNINVNSYTFNHHKKMHFDVEQFHKNRLHSYKINSYDYDNNEYLDSLNQIPQNQNDQSIQFSKKENIENQDFHMILGLIMKIIH